MYDAARRQVNFHRNLIKDGYPRSIKIDSELLSIIDFGFLEPTYVSELHILKVCFVLIVAAEYKLLFSNDIHGCAKKLGGKCGEKNQRYIWSTYGEKTACVYR